jgi:hypothetical protein
MKPLSSLVALVVLAACGAAGAATWPGSAPLQRGPAAPELSCALIISPTPGGSTVRGEVTALAPITGAWDLTLRREGAGGQAAIDQQGRFRLTSGEVLHLSDIMLSGRPEDIRADLTLVTGGQEISCPVRGL